MTGSNGHNQNGNGAAKLTLIGGNTVPKKWDERDDRDELGHYVAGHSGGPGRPKGSLDFMTIARDLAKKTGEPIEAAVETCLSSLQELAAQRDVPAIRTLLDRFCGSQDKGPTVNVGIDARAEGPVGPPMPQGADFGVYLKKMNQVAAQQGLLGDTTPEQIADEAVRAAADKRDEIEELLS